MTARAGARGIGAWIVGLAVALGLFDFVSAGSRWAQRGWITVRLRPYPDAPPRPPVYGVYHPGFARVGVIALVLALACAAAVFVLARRDRIRVAPFLAGAVLCMVAFSTAVAWVNGSPKEALRGVHDVVVARDVATVGSVGGARAFVREYPRIVGTLQSVHSITHPPGRLVVARAMTRAFAGHPFAQALAMAVLSALVLIPLWFLARRLFGERAAFVAVAMLAVAPGPVLFGFASWETVETTLFTGATALLAYGGFARDASSEGDAAARARAWMAVAGGFVIGLATFVTFAAAFVAVIAGLLALMTRPRRDAVRAIALAAAGGVAALIVLRVLASYDLFASYHASREALRALPVARPNFYVLTLRPHLYWLAGAPAAWLTFAGVGIAGLAARELIVERCRLLMAVLAPLAIFYALPARVTMLLPGELERTVAYAYPIAAVAAGAAFARWEQRCGRARADLLAALVLASALQAILLEALYFILW